MQMMARDPLINSWLAEVPGNFDSGFFQSGHRVIGGPLPAARRNTR
jgi:hypothetical protein